MKRRRRFLPALALIVAFASGCGGGAEDEGVTTEEMLRTGRVDLLVDEIYYLPTAEEPGSPIEYLPLRRWDFIFVGAAATDEAGLDDSAFISAAIPGRFDHLTVYLGKDAAGFAYAAELNVDALRMAGYAMQVAGGIRLLCLGTDYGAWVHPSAEQLLDPSRPRTAKTFRPDARATLLAKEAELLAVVREHLETEFHYQLEFEILAGDKQFLLVDDGLAGGAGCADYWVALFEEHAGLCFPGVRMGAAEVADYFRHDPEGSTATVPPQLNPFGEGELRLSDLFEQGFEIIADAPHEFLCDGTQEAGLVVADRILTSGHLTEIPTHPRPVP